ncbi:MAG: hypothetical protein NT009_07850 [Proteobacteria bacterium]|nr:hypothetical protein [Pseudomonadota bacterium]
MSPARKQAERDQVQDLREIQEHFFRAQEEVLKGVVGLVGLASQTLENKSENPACESLVRTLDSLRDFLITLEEVVARGPQNSGRPRKKNVRSRRAKSRGAASRGKTSLARVEIK